MYASWILGSQLLEYIYVLLSLGPFMFGIPDITTSIPSLVLGPSADFGAGLGGTIAPYLAHRFEVVTFFPLLHLWRMLTHFARSLHR